MPAFIVSSVRISDREKFAEYANGIAGLSEAHGGEYIVRGPATEALEGDFIEGERVVIVKFPNADAARAYISDSRYKAAKEKRAGAADVRMLLVEA